MGSRRSLCRMGHVVGRRSSAKAHQKRANPSQNPCSLRPVDRFAAAKAILMHESKQVALQRLGSDLASDGIGSSQVEFVAIK